MSILEQFQLQTASLNAMAAMPCVRRCLRSCTLSGTY